jgi:pimeloyl-ACP methyl ester carboxylesterase
MQLLLLPGMDGTGRLFGPLLRALPSSLSPVVAAYPADQPAGYAELLPVVEAAAPAGAEYVVVGESFSGPLAVMWAARRPPGLRGIVLCASFVRSPLPPFARWLRALIFPLWFRAVPRPLLRWALLGRHQIAALAELVEAAIGMVRPAVLAARARAILSVDVATELQSCPVPVLYLSATEDRLVPPRSLAYIRQLYPAVESVSLVGPHLLLQVAAEGGAEAIQRFAAACECQSATAPDRGGLGQPGDTRPGSKSGARSAIPQR